MNDEQCHHSMKQKRGHFNQKQFSNMLYFSLHPANCTLITADPSQGQCVMSVSIQK